MLFKRFLNEIKYWGQIILLPIYLLSYLMPRDNKIWVLGSTFGRRFADNPKYFYLYLNQYQSMYMKAIWISKDPEIVQDLNRQKHEAYYLYSLKGVWYALRAKVYLYDNYSKDICFTLSGGAIKINMWHGIPLKKINMDNKFDSIRHPVSKRQQFKGALRRVTDEKPSHYVLTTSQKLVPIFKSAFATNRVLISGYPRNDNLIFEHISNIMIGNESTIYDRINKLTGRKVLYMPTFRNSEIKLMDTIKIKELNDFLVENEIYFIIKLHPKSNIKKLLKHEIESVSISNFMLLEAEVDPYPLLNMVDLLITDYSSIYFDFLLTEKPIIFFDYDHKEYISNSRELYYDYNEVTPGMKVHNQIDLQKAILTNFNCMPNKAYISLREAMFNDYNGKITSSDRLYREIKRLLK